MFYIYHYIAIHAYKNPICRSGIKGRPYTRPKFNYLFFGQLRKLIFCKDFLYYVKSDKSKFFEVKLRKIKTCFNTTRMQIRVTWLI